MSSGIENGTKSCGEGRSLWTSLGISLNNISVSEGEGPRASPGDSDRVR